MANYSTFSKLATPYKITEVQGEILVTHSSSVTLNTQFAMGPHTLLLHDVLYIPSMSFSLLSLHKMVEADFIPVFKEIPCKVVIKGTTTVGHMHQIALITICKGRLTLDCKLAPRSTTDPATIFTAAISMDVLHRRLGHSGNLAIKRLLAEGMVHGIQVTKGTEVEPCDAC